MSKFLYLLSVVVLLSSCVDQERREREKKLDRYYELEWVKCVNELGIERCKVIQETGFRQCENFSNGATSGLSSCAEERFKDRMKEVVGEPGVPETVKRGVPEPVKAEAAEDPAP